MHVIAYNKHEHSVLYAHINEKIIKIIEFINYAT